MPHPVLPIEHTPRFCATLLRHAAALLWQMSGQADGAAEGHLGEDDEGGGPAAEAEPTATLRTFRTGEKLGFRKPAWSKEVFFGQNLTVLSPGSTVTVGDLVYAIPRVTPTNF